MKKILYVGDNRNRRNWGCRATSIALRQILDSKVEVGQVIYGERIAFSPKAGLSTSRYYKQRIKNKAISLIKKLGKNNLEFFGGINNDYISDNSQESLNLFLKLKEKDSNLNFIYNSVINSDSIVVNAEGSFIFSTPPRRDTLFFLFLIRLAQHLGKEISIVNGMISECPSSEYNNQIFESTVEHFQYAKLISVRDPQSFRNLDNLVKCHYLPDALFTWFRYFEFDSKIPTISDGDFIIPFPEKEEYFGKLDFSSPYLCVGGSSLAAKDQEKAVISYINLVNQLKSLNINIVLFPGCSSDSFLHRVLEATKVPIIPIETPILLATSILSQARLVISGRYHPSIMASLGGTPCIFLGSNSHKTRSLQEVLEYDQIIEYSAFPDDEECQKISEHSAQLLKEGESRRNQIKAVSKKRAQEASTLSQYIL